MTTPTLAQVELQLAGWRISSNDGAKITFWLPDEADLEPFKRLTERRGKTAGQRLMAVFVEIGDDEQPVAPDKPEPGTVTLLTDAELKAVIKGEPAEQVLARRKGGFSDDVGPLAQWAVLRCAEPLFQEWLQMSYGREWATAVEENIGHGPAEIAKALVCDICHVESRKELDTEPEAAKLFHKYIRVPYAQLHAEG